MMVTALAASLKIYERRCESAMEVLLKLETPLLSDRRSRRRQSEWDVWEGICGARRVSHGFQQEAGTAHGGSFAAKFLSPCKTNPD